MAGPSSISSTLSHHKIANLKFLFRNGIDLQTADRDLINKYVIHKFNLYAADNEEDFNLWVCI